MRIGMIAPPWFPLPPQNYGGIEFVVSLLTEGLVQRGHEVTLFASGDSRTRARLESSYQRAPFERMGDESIEVIHSLEAYTRARDFDVIHDHDGFAGRAMGALVNRLFGTPVVATLHGPADPTTQRLLTTLRHDLSFIAISDYQRNGFPDLHFVATIPNAVDVEHLPFSREKEDYFLFIGRMIADKGAHTAIEVAKRLDARLILAGKVNEAPEREYFAEAVEPHLSERIYYRGEVDHDTKAQLYSKARCTLFPIQWPEPFGLVMIESLAAGTPVIALRQGSVPEVVEHGRTGFIVDTIDDMVEAVHHLDEIDPAECRRAVDRRFSSEAFIAAHEEAYLRVTSGEDGAERARELPGGRTDQLSSTSPA
jgi:glycosyltransferase involved in cell wall biosynthesis